MREKKDKIEKDESSDEHHRNGSRVKRNKTIRQPETYDLEVVDINNRKSRYVEESEDS